MSVNVISVSQINSTTVRVNTTEMTLGCEYNVKVSKVSSTSGNVIDPAYDNANFFGLNTKPRIVSITSIDSSHIDVEFDKEMLNGSALAADHSYAIVGPSSPTVSAAVLDPSNKIVRLTFLQKILNGDYIIEIFGVPDVAGNPIDLNYDDGIFNFVYTALTMNMIEASPTYVNGSMISVYASGIATDDIFPAMQLKIDDVVVKTWAIVQGVTSEYFDYYYETNYFYIHPGQVTIDQIKVEFINAEIGAPDIVGLYGWFQSSASTAIVTCEKEGIKYYVKILLTETLSDPSYYNSLRQDMGTVSADMALTAAVKFRAPVGTQGRMELWVFPNGLGALLSADDFDGTDEWMDVELPSVTPTGIQLNPELRLITNNPDNATVYTEWGDPFVGQEQIVNPDFFPIRDPWTTHIGSLASITLHSELAGTYAKSTLTVPTIPGGRVYHAMEYDSSRRKIVLFFGYTNTPHVYLNDVWEYDIVSMTWSKITVTGTSPTIRGRHSIVYDSDRNIFVLFGGSGGVTKFDDTWEYNGATTTWTQIFPTGGVKPPARYSATVAYDNVRKKIILFGGTDGVTYFDDTWEYDGTTSTWIQITTSNKPAGRYYSAMVYDNNKQRCILFSGMNATTRFDDTWEYNGATTAWVEIVPVGGVKPTHRSEHSMVFDTIRKKCIIFGGQDQHVGAIEHLCADTWEYTAATETWVRVNAGSNPNVSNPSARVAFAMVYCLYDAYTYLFGGYNGSSFTAEFWKFNATTHLWSIACIDYATNGPSHWNSLIQRRAGCGFNKTFRCKGKYRTAIGTIIRVELYFLKGGTWIGTIPVTKSCFAGSNDWEDFELLAELTSSIDHDYLELRMVILSPNTSGTWADWKNISIQKNILKNSRFRPRTLKVERVILDGNGYETSADEIYSTGSWIPGDGSSVVPGYRKTELLTNNGNFSFADSKNTDDAIVAGIDARIETYRKGDGTVHVVGAGGYPINGANISVTQTRHGFQFGCTRHWLTEKRVSQPWTIPRIDAYEARWKELFNMAILGFFWANCEGTNGVFEDAFIQQYAIDWAESMDADMKGVAMLYASGMIPGWVNSIDPNTVKARFLAYITHVVTTFGNKIKQWEIVDELALSYPANSVNQTSAALTNLYKREGVVNLIWEVYNTLKAIDPTASLEINDYNINELYFSLIEQLKLGNVYPFDAIKIQSHMQEDIWSAQKLYWALDKLSTYNTNLHMSEISLFSGKPTYTGTNITDWKTSTAGEAAQAIEAERFLKLAFSHRYVKSISYWDLSDYMAWGSEKSTTGAGSWARGLLRPDMTKKPAFDVVHDLIKNQWWTITSGITAGLGNYMFRGFAGTYDVAVTRAGYVPKTESVTLTTAGDTWTITMASL